MSFSRGNPRVLKRTEEVLSRPSEHCNPFLSRPLKPSTPAVHPGHHFKLENPSLIWSFTFNSVEIWHFVRPEESGVYECVLVKSCYVNICSITYGEIFCNVCWWILLCFVVCQKSLWQNRSGAFCLCICSFPLSCD